MGTINGFDGVDDNISSGGMPSWDTLFSSTYGGDDVVSIFSPHYEIYLGDGNDTVSGGIGGMAFGEGGNDSMAALLWQGEHLHSGGDGADRLTLWYGGAGAIYTGLGGAGDDRFRDGSFGPAVANFDGGSGFDIVVHAGSTAISLTLGGSGVQGSATKTYVSIEGATGANGNDTLNGNRADNLLIGGNGADLINGSVGNDFLIGEGREDNFISAYMGLNINFSAADAYDPLNVNVAGTYGTDGGELADTLLGGTGNDVLVGGDGGDVLNGGLGEDWVSYLSSPEWSSVALGLDTGGTAGHAAGDSFVSIEHVQGSNGNDTIEGSSLGNILRGLLGQDSLSGLGGGDRIEGGGGRDTLSGGRGDDTLVGGDWEDCFVFDGSGALQSIDTISDFLVNHDEIWLSLAAFRRLATTTGALTEERFALGSAAADRDDRIIYDAATGKLFYDADGNRSGAAVQFATLVTGLAVTAGDFVVIA